MKEKNIYIHTLQMSARIIKSVPTKHPHKGSFVRKVSSSKFVLGGIWETVQNIVILGHTECLQEPEVRSEGFLYDSMRESGSPRLGQMERVEAAKSRASQNRA